MYILKRINEFNYCIKLEGDYVDVLYDFLIKLVPNATYDSYSKCVYFSAEKVSVLTSVNKMWDSYVDLIDCLSKQMLYLKNLGYGFYGFGMKDILTIDDKYIIINNDVLKELHNDYIIIDSLIEKPYFSSPEIINMKVLPSRVYYSCEFYSLGSLLVYCLFGKHLFIEEDVDRVLFPITNTKIYWFIKRCIHEDVKKRSLLLI